MQYTIEQLTGKGSPFELVDSTVGNNRCKLFRHGPQTLTDVYRRAQSFGSRPYVASGRESMSYQELLRGAGILARALTQHFGIAEGKRVGIALGNCPQWVLSFIAATAVGNTAVALPFGRSTEEISRALDLSGCAVVITDVPTAQRLFELGDRRPAIKLDTGADGLIGPLNSISCDLIHSSGDDSLFSIATPIDPDQDALIAFTSGTTSRPKAVVSTHRGVTTGMMNMMFGGALAADNSERRRPEASMHARMPQTTALVATPFSHVSGYFSLLLAAYLGGRVISLSSWDAHDALDLISRESVSSLVGVTPATMRELLESDSCCTSLSRLKTISLQGAAPHPRIFQEIATALPGVGVGTGYGMTETNGSVCVASGAQLLQRPTTSGRPLPSIELRLVGEGGRTVGATETGEICLQGAMLMRGYCSSGSTATDVLPGGWFRTGDLGQLDGEGFLHITDRHSQLIVCGGRRVSATQVEDTLLHHAAVMEAAAVGVGDEPDNQRLVVAFAPRPGHVCDETEIAAYLRRHASLDHITPQILRLESLPRTTSGKIDRRAIREGLLMESQQAYPC